MSSTDNRNAAGAAYRAAAEAYIEAWVELEAHDHAGNALRRFAEQPHVAGHSEFLPDASAVRGDVVGRSRAKSEQMIVTNDENRA